MAKFKNPSKDTTDKDGNLVEAQTVSFKIQKVQYDVAPGEEIEIPVEHEAFVRSRGIALELAKGESYADSPSAGHNTKGPRKTGSDAVPAQAPAFAGDVKQSEKSGK